MSSGIGNDAMGIAASRLAEALDLAMMPRFKLHA